MLVLVAYECRSQEALWSYIQTPEMIQPVLETVDTGYFNNFLRQSIPLIHDSYTETVRTYSSVASLLEQLKCVAPQTVLLDAGQQA